jgi:hypothetical protein
LPIDEVDSLLHLGQTCDRLHDSSKRSVSVCSSIAVLASSSHSCFASATRSAKVRSKYGSKRIGDDGSQSVGLQGGPRIDLRLLDTKSLAPTIFTLLRFFERRGGQAKFTNLLDGQCHREAADKSVVASASATICCASMARGVIARQALRRPLP